MTVLILGGWLVQGAVGATLAVAWWRGRRTSRTVVAHVLSSLVGVAAWTTYVVTDALVAAWVAVLAITIGNGFGDEMLLQRVQHRTGTTSKRRNYPAAIGAIVRGQMPARVAFHAMFAGVVYFGSLIIAVRATVSALGG